MTTPVTARAPIPGIDPRYRDEELHGAHCQVDGHLAAMGLTEHTKCPGWWQTDTIDGQPVGFRCACHCHPEGP